MSILRSAVFLLVLLFLFFITQSKTIFAQSCSGTFACGDNVGYCRYPDGSACDNCSLGNLGGCTIQYQCDIASLDRSCSGSGGISTCGAYGCGVGGCVFYDGCGSTCDGTNCFNRSCTDVSSLFEFAFI